MEGAERRRKLMKILETKTEPISGTELAKQLGVSRQVIVQDVALIRAANQKLAATPRGYLLYESAKGEASRIFHVKHTTQEIEEELTAIVECGGRIKNVTVGHPIYGEIETKLPITTKKDILEFLKKISKDETKPLKDLTGGEHGHLVEADSEAALDDIQRALEQKHYLIKE